MSIETLFPSQNLSNTEEDILIEIFANPFVKKYLRRMALEETKELISLSALTTDRDRLSQAHALVQGKLQVLTTLLSIGETQLEVSINPTGA